MLNLKTNIGWVILVVLLPAAIWGQYTTTTFDPPTPQNFAGFGRAMAAIGDVNNDGAADLLVSAATEDVSAIVDAGRVYILNGVSGALLYQLDTPNPVSFGTFGFTVAAADLNNDATKDLIIGSQETVDGLSGAGRVYVFDGTDGAPLYSVAAPTPAQFAWFSRSLAVLNDLNNDGIAEWVAGSSASPNGINGAGQAYVFNGTNGNFLFAIDSPNPNENGAFSISMATIADVNNDGFSDLLIGSEETPDSLTKSGRAYLVSGADGTLIHTLNSMYPKANGKFGWTVAAPGDLNADEVPDLFVGSSEDVNGFVDAGRGYLFDGASGNFLFSIEAPNPNHVDWFSRAVSNAGDANNDGTDDLLIAAPLADVSGTFDAGRVYLFSGANGVVFDSLTALNREFNGLFGFSLLGNWQASISAADYLISSYTEDVDNIGDAGRIYRFRRDNVAIDWPDNYLSNEITLAQNYPNPFNPLTNIEFRMGDFGWVDLKIYDISGSLVKTLLSENRGPGSYTVNWDGRNEAGTLVTSGIYFYTLTTGAGFRQTKKMLLTK